MDIRVTPTEIPEVKIIEPAVFEDSRGVFFESFNKQEFEAATGEAVEFVQDNHLISTRGVLRGLHFQAKRPQGKLVRVVAGEVFDVAVDIRPGSATFGRWVGAILSEKNRRQKWVPVGFAHGFLVLSDYAEVLCKVTDYRCSEHQGCLLWSDAGVGVKWPLATDPVLSSRDAAGVRLADLVL